MLRVGMCWSTCCVRDPPEGTMVDAAWTFDGDHFVEVLAHTEEKMLASILRSKDHTFIMHLYRFMIDLKLFYNCIYSIVIYGFVMT